MTTIRKVLALILSSLFVLSPALAAGTGEDGDLSDSIPTSNDAPANDQNLNVDQVGDVKKESLKNRQVRRIQAGASGEYAQYRIGNVERRQQRRRDILGY